MSERRRTPRPRAVSADQLFSAEYLDWYYPREDIGHVLDPRNMFNDGQGAQAFGAFTSLASGQPGQVLHDFGLRPLRTSLARDSLIVKMEDKQGLARLRAQHPSLDVGRNLRVQPQWVQAVQLDVEKSVTLLATTGARLLTLRVVGADGQPVAGAKVVLVYDLAREAGTEAHTGADGSVRLFVPRQRDAIDSLAVFPRHSYWAHGQRGWALPAQSATITLRALDGAHAQQFHRLPPATATDGQGVKVAVIDGGAGPHPALVVAGGENLVLPEVEDPAEAASFADNGLGHGTHVAGIIAARDLGQGGPVGLAPGVTLHAYRVFAKGKRDGDDSTVAEAIDAAVADGCDLLNLSLGFPSESRLITRALRRAFAKGAVAVAAVGNAGGKPVYFPAATPGVIGVTALGRRSRLPAESVSAMTWQAQPAGADPDDFVGVFSNKGLGVTVAAPGVGIISCAPGGTYAVEDGTSMAAPVVTGLAARVLAQAPDIMAMPRDQNRADAIRARILGACDQLGFPIDFVGNGHPLP